jgi:uncharacterized membrane protein
MSIFSIVGRPEPQWAKNFKANVIEPDYLPNPLKKTQSNQATQTIAKVEKDAKVVLWVVIVLILVFVFGGRK